VDTPIVADALDDEKLDPLDLLPELPLALPLALPLPLAEALPLDDDPDASVLCVQTPSAR